MKPDDNEKGPLISDMQQLKGVTIKNISIMPAEVTRHCKHYVMIQAQDVNDNPMRLLFAFTDVGAACPDHGDMLDDAIDGIDFWRLSEIRQRQRGEALLQRERDGFKKFSGEAA